MGRLTKKIVSIFLSLMFVLATVPIDVVSAYVKEEASLPAGFNSVAIGSGELSGEAIFNNETKSFTVNGVGNAIGKDPGSTDSYQFLNYRLEGDVTITARLVDFDMSNAIYGQAGLIVRADNETNDADYFAAYVEPSKNQYRYAFRDKNNSRVGAATIAGLDANSKNLYIKLQKIGSSFKYFISQDSTFPADNTYSNTQTVSSTNDVWYVGMVVSNGNSTESATATFDNIRIENSKKVYFDSNLEIKPVETVENLVAKSGDSQVILSWNEVDEATSYIVKRSTELNGDYSQIAKVDSPITAYTDKDVVNFTAYYYKVIAVNDKGESNDSLVAIGMPNNSNSEGIQYGKDKALFNMTQEPNDTVTNPYITVQGSVDREGTISIKQNGVLNVDNIAKLANEQFEYKFTLKNGRNEIQISHKDADGNVALKKYNIVYLKESFDKVVDLNYDGIDGELVNNVPTYKTISAAVASVDSKNNTRVKIFVKNGTYKEKTIVASPYISIVGEDSKKTVWTYDAANGTINPETNTPYGTSKSASVTINRKAVGFTAENITIENSFVEKGNNNEQAVALNNEADQSIFINCRFIGDQDTLLANSSSSYSARQYYYNCYIEGDVDFIFGRAQAVFDNCDIVSSDRGSKYNNGYITAANTWDKDKYGYLIINSRLLGDSTIADNSVSLGRPWRPSNATKTVTPQVAYVNCYMGEHITSKGWEDMGVDSPASTARFSEYASYGPGALLSETRPVLTTKEASDYTIEKVFAKNSASNDDGTDAYQANWDPRVSSEVVNMNTIYGSQEEDELIFNVIKHNSSTIKGSGVKGSTIIAYVDSKEIGKTIVGEDGKFVMEIIPQPEDTIITLKMTKEGYLDVEKTYKVLKLIGDCNIDRILPNSTAITGKGSIQGLYVRAYVNGVQIGNTARTDANCNFKINIPAQPLYTDVTVKFSKKGYGTYSKTVTVLNLFAKELTADTIKTNSTATTGKGQVGAYIRAYVNGVQIGNTARVDSKGNYKINIPLQVSKTMVTVKMSRKGYLSTTVTKKVLIPFNSILTVYPVSASSTKITGKGQASAYIRAYVGGKQIGDRVKIDKYGRFELDIPRQRIGTKVTVKMSKLNYATVSKVITVR